MRSSLSDSFIIDYNYLLVEVNELERQFLGSKSVTISSWVIGKQTHNGNSEFIVEK